MTLYDLIKQTWDIQLQFNDSHIPMKMDKCDCDIQLSVKQDDNNEYYINITCEKQ